MVLKSLYLLFPFFCFARGKNVTQISGLFMVESDANVVVLSDQFNNSVLRRQPKLSLLPKDENRNENEHLCSDSYCLQLNYDRLSKPKTADGGPIELGVEIEGIRIIDMDDKTFSVSLQMYLGLRWKEPRIFGPPSPYPDVGDYIDYEDERFVALDTKFVRHLWVPDIYVYNMKYGSRTLQDFDGRLFVFNGNEIFYRQELIIEIWCPLRFTFYPLDHQRCNFILGSYAYSVDDMHFTLERLQYDWSQANALLDYVLVEPLKEDLTVQRLGNKTYSVAGFNIRLKRRSFQYIFNFYLPSVLFVVVSWTGFLVPPDLIAGRVTILITLFVVLIAIFNTVNLQSPPVEGFTALAFYVMICIIFVFGQVFYYAILLQQKKKEAEKRFDMRANSLTVTHLFPLAQLAMSRYSEEPFKPLPRELSARRLSTSEGMAPSAVNGIVPPTRLGGMEVTWDVVPSWHARRMHFADKVFIVIFPGFFTVFNVLYWHFLFNYQDYLEEEKIVIA